MWLLEILLWTHPKVTPSVSHPCIIFIFTVWMEPVTSLSTRKWQRLKDFADVSRIPNQWFWVNWKGDCSGSAWLNQVNVLKREIVPSLKWRHILLVIFKNPRKWILPTTWLNLETHSSPTKSPDKNTDLLLWGGRAASWTSPSGQPSRLSSGLGHCH